MQLMTFGMEEQEIPRVLALLVILVPPAIFWFIYRRIQSSVHKLPPGPSLSLPLLGYLPFVTKEPHKKFYELSKTYGPLVSVSLGTYKAVIVSDYENGKELLSHPATLGRPTAFFSFVPYAAGFAGMNGEEWQEQRGFCIHTMRTLGIGKGPWERIIQNDVMEFIEYLDKWKGKPVDVSEPLMRSAICSIAALTVGRRFPNKDTNPDVKVIEKAHHIIMDHGRLSNPATIMPWLLKYFIKFNIAGYADKKKVLETFCDIFRREIAKHQHREDNPDSSDFVGRYLDVLNQKDSSDDYKHYSVENLIGHMIALFIGGSDTVVASLNWLLLLMAEHPKVQEKVQQEIYDVFGRDGQTSWGDKKKLPYTMATIFEMERWASITRFYPPRRVSETFEFHDYTIPKGVLIFGNGWAINRDPKHWDNPDKFMPERFLQIAEKSGKDPSKLDGYAPFSFGKRNCPGETVAIMTIFLYFTRIMQKFAVGMPPGCSMKVYAEYSGVTHPCKQVLRFTEK